MELIVYSDDPNRPAKINILLDYLDVFKSKAEKDNTVDFLSNFLQAWAYAVQTNNDYLASSVSSILALLLKTLATLPELRHHGILLCRTLLKTTHLKIISRSISAPKTKEHIISPCLRILTEIVCFDAGSMAKSLYAKREFTFESRIMARNLGLFKSEEDRRRPSVRSNAIRYLLANFRFQDEGAKIDILKHSHVTKALFDHMKEDPMDVFQESLNVIEANILRDEAIPRSTKSYTMSDRSLSGLLAVLRAQSAAESDADVMQVDGELPLAAKGKAAALNFLKLVCTTPTLGVLRASGWYPPGTEKHTKEETEEPDADTRFDLGLDSVDWYDQFQNQVPVRNTILSGFLQTLRPHASEEERELLLATFAAGPELVADYFFNKANKFPFDPKLTNTWIGYASFLFSAVELPFPKYFGANSGYPGCPPPISITIENILPLPLTQKVMTRCLNQSSDLITLFAIRILVVAFQKLQRISTAFSAAASQGNHLWQEASDRLLSEFRQRCPTMKDVVAVFRRIPEDNVLQREAVSRLIRLFYDVTPQSAMDEKFDVSTSLTSILSRVETMDPTDNQYSFRLLELQHLLVVAQSSVGMRWWHKQGSLKFSPFVTLLRLCTRLPKDQPIVSGFLELIASVVSEHDLLQQQTKDSAISALIASLSSCGTWTPTDATFTFLDECLGRLVRKPIKYLDDLASYKIESANGNKVEPLSLLLLGCLEQVPFTVNLPKEDQENVQTWISLFVDLLAVVGEDKTTLLRAKSEIEKYKTEKLDLDLYELLRRVPYPSPPVQQEGSGAEPTDQREKLSGPSIAFSPPPTEKQNHVALAHHSFEESLEKGYIADLLLCLSSRDRSIRRAALTQLQRMVATIRDSSIEEKDQLYVLWGELLETARPVYEERPLPYIATVFATHAMKVLLEPTHFMYPRVNKYLSKGPTWQVSKLASYWVDKSILDMPEEDDKHWAEVEWVLDFLLDGTRVAQDALLLVSRDCMEKILGLYASPQGPRSVKEKIMQLVYRVAVVDRATSLVTRSGIMAWLDERASLKDVDAKSLDVVKGAILGNVDKRRLGTWSKGAWKRSEDAIPMGTAS